MARSTEYLPSQVTFDEAEQQRLRLAAQAAVDQGWTVTELAHAAVMERTYLHKFLSARSTLSVAVASRLARALGLHIRCVVAPVPKPPRGMGGKGGKAA